MPNIGAFIAWVLSLHYLLKLVGFLMNQLASIQGPMLTYLLPILIAYQGGKMW